MAAPSISTFLDKIRNSGFANPSRYTVDIFRNSMSGNTVNPVPNTVGNSQDISLNCEIVSIPGFNLLTGERRYYGPTVKIPYLNSYSDMTMSFYCSEDHRERLYFEDWLNSIIDPITRDLKFYDSYACNIIVTNYDNSNRVSLSCKLLKAYPIAVTPIDLGYSNTQSIEKIMVNFAYLRYEPIKRATTI